MDLNNFAQGVNADSISRIAAVETGPDTGVFEGSVTYNHNAHYNDGSCSCNQPMADSS